MTTASTTVSTTGRRVFTGALTFLLTFLVGATAAVADTPLSDDWPVKESRSTLDILLLFGGGTIGLFVLISLFAVLTARTNYVPPAPSQDLATTAGSDAATH
ncbi:MAG: hypothetical protein WB508_03315 [Aeromicrobium sp.]|uniref:hypothetical protein n=1 Tax=Aeromicrobium sp. TaxID=1871063 RepID=UPI003C5EB21B